MSAEPNAPVIRTRGLTKRYGDVTALDALDLDVFAGEVVGYLGPNAAGKSTTLALLVGLARPTAGTAELFGLDARRDATRIHGRLGYVPSDVELWPSLTGAEVLDLLGDLHGSVDRTYRAELLERFDLDPGTKVRALSHGNRQKVLLVAAFAGRPDLLLLDEPTSGLDPLMERAFQLCVREAADRGQSVLLSSHILSEVDAVCDRVAMLRRGRLVQLGDLDLIRSLSAVRFELDVVGPVPDLADVDGVTVVTSDGATVRGEVVGPVGPLLRALSSADVRRFSTHEPSLEDLFLARYGDDLVGELAGVP